ncbi:hypothetical protein CDAR_242921, partial [Caerostris darwini]
FDEIEVDESIEEFRSTALSNSSISVDQLLVAPSMNMDTEELDEFCFNNDPVAASTPAEDFIDTTKFNYTGNFDGDDHFVPIQETELDLTHGKAIPITSTHNFGDNLHYVQDSLPNSTNTGAFQAITEDGSRENDNNFSQEHDYVTTLTSVEEVEVWNPREGFQTSTSSKGFQTSTSSKGFQTSTSSKGFQTSTSSKGFQTSTSSKGFQTSTSSKGFQASTSSRGFQASTSSRRFQASTSSRGFQTSTSSRGFQTSTSSRGFQTSTSSRGFQTSTSSRGFQTSTSSRGFQTSTSSRGFQTSTSSRGFQTSTSSKGFQTSTSSRGFQTSTGYNNGDNLHHGRNHLRYSTHSGAFQTPTRYNYRGNIRHESGYRMAPVRLLQSPTTRCNYEDDFRHVQSTIYNSTPVGAFQTRRRYNYQDNLHDEHEHLSNATPARSLKNIKKDNFFRYQNPVTLNTLVEEFRNTLGYNPEDNLRYNEDHVPNSTPDRDKTLKSVSPYPEFEIPDTLKEPYIEANNEIYDYNNPESNFLKETNGKGANSIPDSTFDDSQSLNSCSTNFTTDSEQTSLVIENSVNNAESQKANFAFESNSRRKSISSMEQKSSLDDDNNDDDKDLQEIKNDSGTIRHISFFKSSRFASEKQKKIAKYLERLKNTPICPLSNPGHSSEDERIMIPVKLNGVPEGKTY